MGYFLAKFRTRIDHEKVNEALASCGAYLNKDEEKQLIQCMLDNSKHELRMYGTAQEVVEQLGVYCDFPESHRFFDSFTISPYFTAPNVYLSLKNEQYVCKPDLFLILQQMLCQILPKMKSHIYVPLWSIFLKTHEKKISSKLEFVRYDIKVFKEIEKEVETCLNVLGAALSKNSTGNGGIPVVFKRRCSLEVIYNKFKTLIPAVWKEEFGVIEKYLEHEFEETKLHKRSKHFDTLFFECNNILKCLTTIIEKRPEMFLLHSETKNNKMPSTVRVFRDGSNNFVMKAELYQAMNEDLKHVESQKHSFDTLEMQEVNEKFGDRIQNIEFIWVVIQRAKHKAVPIRGPNSEEFCILAVDALFEFLRELIFGIKLFQILETIPFFVFSRLKHFFSPDLNFQYFFKMEAYHELRDSTYNSFIFYVLAPVKKVRNAKEDGFTVDNLKSELTYLGFTKIFPEIIDHAEVVYEEVMRVKKEKFLRTCDLYDALEHCLLICIFNQFSELRSFLHNQKACGRVLTLECDSCIAKSPSSVPSIDPDSQNISKVVNPAQSENSILSEEESNKVENQDIDSQNNLECASNLKSALTKKEVNTSDENLNIEITEIQSSEPVTEQKDEPENCEKCAQSYKNLEETKKELNTSQSEMEKLEMKMLENEKKLAEVKNEYEGNIDKFKKNLEASQKENQALKKEVAEARTLQAKISGIEKELAESRSKSEKNIEKLKKDLEEKRVENEKLNREAVIHSKIVRQNEELKLKISKCGRVEIQLKDRNSKQKVDFDKERLEYSAKISELENELESKKQAIVKFEEQVDELKLKCGSENQRTLNLEQEIVELRQQLECADDIRAGFDKERAQFSDKMTELKQELESEKQKSVSLEQEIIQLRKQLECADNKKEENDWILEKRQLQEAILEKSRHINEIHESNIKLRTENEVNSRMVQNLLDKLAAVSIANVNGPMNRPSNMYHLQPPGSAPFFYNHPMYSYGSEVPIHTSPPHSIDDNRVPSTSSVNDNLPTSSLMTLQEMQPAVDPNLLKTGNVPDARVLPENRVPSTPPVNNNTSLPSSKHPEKRNWNDQKTTSNSELADSECLICFVEMRSRQKTIKCHQCRRRFHSNCASKWLKVKSECPACRGRLLDPKEYPSLS